MQHVSAKRAGVMPAILREGLLRRRQAMNDPAFRNRVKDGVDATVALSALAAIGGELKLPDQVEPIILSDRANLNSVWAIFERMSIAWRRRVYGSNPPARAFDPAWAQRIAQSRSDRRRNFAAGAAASAIAVTDHGGPPCL